MGLLDLAGRASAADTPGQVPQGGNLLRAARRDGPSDLLQNLAEIQECRRFPGANESDEAFDLYVRPVEHMAMRIDGEWRSRAGETGILRTEGRDRANEEAAAAEMRGRH
jgi:hypothetical protein